MRLLASAILALCIIGMRLKHIERSEGTFRAIERGRGHRYGYRTPIRKTPLCKQSVITGKALDSYHDAVCKIFSEGLNAFHHL